MINSLWQVWRKRREKEISQIPAEKKEDYKRIYWRKKKTRKHWNFISSDKLSDCHFSSRLFLSLFFSLRLSLFFLLSRSLAIDSGMLTFLYPRSNIPWIKCDQQAAHFSCLPAIASTVSESSSLSTWKDWCSPAETKLLLLGVCVYFSFLLILQLL